MSQIARIVLALALLTLLGTLGYAVIEGWNLFDALYMTVITLTTVGYEEVHRLSTAGRIFTMCFLVLGLGVFFFGVVALGEAVVRVQLGDWLGRRKMDSTLKSLRDHYIVCGYGRFGRRLCDELVERNLRFLVIDKDPENLAPCRERGWPCLVGDATEDQTLQEAGIDQARGLASALSTDADNLYVVLSARLLSKKLTILSKASTDKDAEKLRRAGADRVISLYSTGAAKMAQLLANPSLEDFIELVTSRGKEVDLAELTVRDDAPYAGKPLAESGFGKRGIVIVGIRRRSGELILPPGGRDTPLPGDCLIALGAADSIREMIGTG